MELPVIDFGNAKGIELSETLFAKYSIGNKVELILEEGYIILKSKIEPRKGWENAFREMHENGDDRLLIDDVFADENFDEWNK